MAAALCDVFKYGAEDIMAAAICDIFKYGAEDIMAAALWDVFKYGAEDIMAAAICDVFKYAAEEKVNMPLNLALGGIATACTLLKNGGNMESQTS